MGEALRPPKSTTKKDVFFQECKLFSRNDKCLKPSLMAAVKLPQRRQLKVHRSSIGTTARALMAIAHIAQWGEVLHKALPKAQKVWK